MPKQIRPEEFETILQAVTKHPEGVSTGALEKHLRRKISHRTLIRRLGELVRQGKLRTQGGGRALFYLPGLPAPTALVQTSGIPSAEGFGTPMIEPVVPLSPEGEGIRSYIRKPPAERRPVGYRREFLDNYAPNRTAYLPQDIRKHLHRIGRPPGGERPAGTYARQIYNNLTIDLSWASSRLEGNTYSRLDTQRLIDFGQHAPGKDAHEAQMILNHKAAIEFLIDQAEEVDFNTYTFFNLHALLSENLMPNPQASGRLRQIPVNIGQTVYHPLAIPQVVEECFRQILDTARAVSDPFEQAFFLLVQIPYLQPFEDVNKRVSRLGANIPLIKRNLCPLSYVDVPERAYIDGVLGVYELNRVELMRDVFVWAYERSCQRYVAVRQSMTEPDPFRLRYRDALIESVAKVVRERDRDLETAIQTYANSRLPVEDRERFVAIAVEEIKGLHEGKIARFRLHPSEFRAWKQATLKK